LPAVDLVRDWRRHAGSSSPDLEQLLALVCAIGHETPVIDHLEDQVPGGSNGSTTDATPTIGAPGQPVLHRIPSLQAATDAVRRRRTDGWRLNLTRLSARAHIAVGAWLVFFGRLID